ncbi:MAG: hypothetical protein R3B45_00395 [Bdellovibrionota bacterium]
MQNLDQKMLYEKTLGFGAKASHAKQVSSRLKKVLPIRLKDIERRYRTKQKPGRAARLALADRDYEKLIHELVEVNAEAFRSRILWEMHCLFIDARRSMQAYQKGQKKG